MSMLIKRSCACILQMSKISPEQTTWELRKMDHTNIINTDSNSKQMYEPKSIEPVAKTKMMNSSASPLSDINLMGQFPKMNFNPSCSPPHESKKKDPSCRSGNLTSNARPQTKSMELVSKNNVLNSPYGLKSMDPVSKTNAANHQTTKTIADSEATTTTTTTNTKVVEYISAYGRGGSDSTSTDGLDSSSVPLKPHTGGDGRWDAINLVNFRDSPIGLSHFRLLKRLGYGDIGCVYLVELRGTQAFFAMKVMDKAALASRNKLLRAQTEREILGLLDHPFLPTLYTHFETDKFYCLVMEFCSGGNLHSLRQKQPNKHFTEQAARFYASEVLLALEYLHMLGIVYRDLKPENVLVREEGHIMLSDFDLSLRCNVNPTLVKSSSVHVSTGGEGIVESEYGVQGCIQPTAFLSRILPKKSRKAKSDFGLAAGGTLPELMAEPTNARSMSFVGTHEYLAPEIIRGEGHGSAVDWWTFGIFLYELLHGTTPFKGSGNHATLFNVVGQPLKFPETPGVSVVARELIRGLLVKDPQKRIAYKRGATEIKQHPFFEGVNWALIRGTTPPLVPDPVDLKQFATKDSGQLEKKMPASCSGINGSKSNSHDSSAYLDFEYF
ncbi:hypothetical protein Scep_011125 [Stephania cephalantha]|uniref:non-specific serine/threonine protein kinase n=1 Tax=Stephania cephalantha TaxID=152367 RepID=A0AAP0JER7_9MAGN